METEEKALIIYGCIVLLAVVVPIAFDIYQNYHPPGSGSFITINIHLGK